MQLSLRRSGKKTTKKKRRERWLRGTKEGDVHLPVERSPASPTAGAAPPRDRARGAGSEGTQVIEVSPPSLHPSARSPPPPPHRPIHTAGTITLPITPPAGPRDPALLTKRDSAGPFPLNLSAPAPREWRGCPQNWRGGKREKKEEKKRKNSARLSYFQRHQKEEEEKKKNKSS